jgi:hypothetical protein
LPLEKSKIGKTYLTIKIIIERIPKRRVCRDGDGSHVKIRCLATKDMNYNQGTEAGLIEDRKV